MPKSDWSRRQDMLEGRRDAGDDYVGVWVKVLKVRELSILVDADGEEHFIPQSQINRHGSDALEEGDEGMMLITGWLARRLGIVGS